MNKNSIVSETDSSDRLQKVLANAGFASRRTVEQWILAGRIRVDEHVAKLGERVNECNQVFLDGDLLTNLFVEIKPKLLMYHKSEGEICTRSDEKGRAGVFDNLPPLKSGRWVMVGRLDANSSGLLLFTNDGALANRLLHPGGGFEREYLVRVLGRLSDSQMAALKKGVYLEDGRARFLSITQVAMRDPGKANKWYKVVIGEGRNRLVRRLFASQNCEVNRLKRVRFGPLVLPKNLGPKHYIEIEESLLSIKA